MSARDTSVPFAPLRILLVTDDDAFARELARLAAEQGVVLARIPHESDPELAAYGLGANVVAVDIDEAPRRRVRTATALAANHPRVSVVVLASSPGRDELGLPLVAKSPAETALRELGRVRV